jgi:hypothetical protein
LSIPRQPNVRQTETAPGRGGRVPEASAAWSASSLTGAGAASTVLTREPPLRRRLAGEREEDLVEAGLAEREARDRDPGVAELGERLRGALRVGHRDRERGGVALEVHGGPEAACQKPLGLGALPRVEQPHLQRGLAHRRLELPRRPLGDHAPVVDDRDPARELVGLVEVLRAEQHRGALGDERAHDVPHLVARARVQPGRRLVEEHQLGGHDDARGDVQPPAHAARVVLDQAPGGLLEAERGDELLRAGVGLPARVAEQAPEQHEVLRAAEVLVDRGELAGQADALAHRVGVGDDVVAEHARAAAVGLEQRREHPDRGGLPGPVGPEHPVDRCRGAPRGPRRRRRGWARRP